MRDFFDIVPCFGFLGFFILLFGFIALMRYISYRETLALLEKGLAKPAKQNGNGNAGLVWGVIIAALGLALSLGLYPIGFMTGTNLPLGIGPWMVAGFIPMFFGLGLILIHVLTREKKDTPDKDKPSNSPEN